MCQLASHCVSQLFTSYSARTHHQTHSRAVQCSAVKCRGRVVKDTLGCFDSTCHTLTDLRWCLPLGVDCTSGFTTIARVMAIRQFHFRHELINGRDAILQVSQRHYWLHLAAFRCFVTCCKSPFTLCSMLFIAECGMLYISHKIFFILY